MTWQYNIFMDTIFEHRTIWKKNDKKPIY